MKFKTKKENLSELVDQYLTNGESKHFPSDNKIEITSKNTISIDGKETELKSEGDLHEIPDLHEIKHT